MDSSDPRHEGISLDRSRARPHIAGMSLIRNHGALAKTVTFALVHFGVAFSIAYLITGSIGIASALALVEPMANTVAYYFHERAWQWLRALPGATSSPAASRASASAG
jgi:uncharacterized membrane protein